MSLDTDLMTPERQEESPPAEPEPQPQVAAAEPLDEDAALDAELEKHAVELPEGEKLVPLSAVTTVRTKLKERRAAEEQARTEAAQHKENAERYQQAWQEAQPFIQAAQAMLAAQQQAQPPPQADDQPDPLAEQLATTLDLYTQDGKPDAARGKKLAGLVQSMAKQIADQAVAPMHQQTVSQQSQYMLERALATAGKGGQKPDPAQLRTIWNRLDPNLTATKEGALWAWTVALGAQVAADATPAAQRHRGADGKFTSEPPADPLYTEKAGGRVEPNRTPLNDMEKKAARDLGMSEAEYVKAYNPPWRR